MTFRGRVRRAEARDLDRVAALWCAVTQHHARLDPLFTMRRDAAGELRRLLDALARDPDAAIFVLETEDGRVSGLCIVRVDRAPPILEETERAEITDLFVAEALRRCGAGRALVAAALDWTRARGIGRVEVRVATGNVEGQGFWRALGFGALMDVLHRRL